MNNKHDQIEDLFSRSETQKSVTPPAHVWERIDNRLQHKKITKRVSLYKYISAAAVGLCLVAVGLMYQKNKAYASASYYIEDLTTYHLLDKSNINYFTYRRLIGKYTTRDETIF